MKNIFIHKTIPSQKSKIYIKSSTFFNVNLKKFQSNSY